MKRCTACQTEKDPTEFYKRKNGNRYSHCRACMRAKAKARYIKRVQPNGLPRKFSKLSEELQNLIKLKFRTHQPVATIHRDLKNVDVKISYATLLTWRHKLAIMDQPAPAQPE